MLERRSILGGACVTEEVWPGARVSRASYVVSMLQPKVVSDLRLRDYGYRAIPLDPAYAALSADGPIFFFNEPARTASSIKAFSKRDSEVYEGFEDLLDRTASFLRPMMLREPPALGSHHPSDLVSLLREGGRAAGLGRRDVHDLVRIFTMSVADLLDDWFEHEGLKGSIASTGVVGVWAGPRTPGTAYNLLHHALGEIDGIPGGWGQVIGGMGAISQAIARSAEAAGAEIRTGAPVASIDIREGRVVGVTLADGEEIRAPIVASGAHPKTTILDLAGAEHFPDDVARDMRRYRTRGGSVKINLILSEAPRYERGDRGAAAHAGAHRRQPLPLDRLPGARLAGRPGRKASERAVRRGRVALRGRLEPDRRRPLGDDDVHPVRPTRRGGLGGRRP